jgi:predicted lipid carrier protein YhbT
MTPFVPTLPSPLAALLARLPLTPVQPLLAMLLGAVVRRHPGIFERLGEHASKRFAIDPTDLPFAFVLHPLPSAPRIRAVRTTAGVDVRIAGPLAALIGLTDGTYDGDALFFARDIAVEGDMEAVLALRNAIDDAGVDLIADAAADFGPVASLAEQAARSLFAACHALGRAAARNAEGVRWS